MRILVNAIGVASAGGWGVLRGLIPALAAVGRDDFITTLVPRGAGRLLGMSTRSLQVIEQRRSGPRWLWRLLDDFYRLPALSRRLRPDVFFSLTDLGPRRTGCPHVMLLHNAWVTHDLPRWKIGGSWRDRLIYATYYPARFRRLWPSLARVIVQTPVVAERLRTRFGVPANRIVVVTPGCDVRARGGAPRRNPVASREPLRLFWPARGYWHKNHAVLVPLCQELVRRGLDARVRVFVTLEKNGDRRVRRLLRSLEPYAPIVTNLGPLVPADVHRWFRETDALLLPTLLESFSLTYIEAAAWRRPVLTSDRDFARHACGAAGYYFDPEDPVDICGRILELIEDIEHGAPRVPAPSAGTGDTPWGTAGRSVLAVLHDAVYGSRVPGRVRAAGWNMA